MDESRVDVRINFCGGEVLDTVVTVREGMRIAGILLNKPQRETDILCILSPLNRREIYVAMRFVQSVSMDVVSP